MECIKNNKTLLIRTGVPLPPVLVPKVSYRRTFGLADVGHAGAPLSQQEQCGCEGPEAQSAMLMFNLKSQVGSGETVLVFREMGHLRHGGGDGPAGTMADKNSFR